MSAYIVDDKVIDFIISAYKRAMGPVYPKIVFAMPDPFNCQEFDLSEQGDCDKLGQLLVDANYASVNARYRENDEPEKYRFREHRAVYDMGRDAMIAQALRSISCLDYQSCEVRGWEYSYPKRILSELYERLANSLSIVKQADWGAPDHLPEGKGPISLMSLVK